jgi:Fe-S-cluster containining protein
MACSHCGDACCNHGVDVSVRERDRILARADQLEPLVGVPRAEWFGTQVVRDDDFPGAAATRTTVVNGTCVFRQRGARGCLLHAVALQAGEDYHDIKPMVSTLFPVTFGDGALLCSEELYDGSLVCGGSGPTAYEMARDELAYYFGSDLVSELDRRAVDARS